MSDETLQRVRKAEKNLMDRLKGNPGSTLTDKEKMELLNLRKRVVAQKEEIRRLQEQIKRLKETKGDGT